MPGMRTTEATKRAIISDLSLGLTRASVAKKYGRSRRTICRILEELKRESPMAELAQDGAYKERLKAKAVRAVEAALDDPSQSYKRGTIGVRVLAGLGEFEREAASIISEQHIHWGEQYAVERHYYGDVAVDKAEEPRQLPEGSALSDDEKISGESPATEKGGVH